MGATPAPWVLRWRPSRALGLVVSTPGAALAPKEARVSGGGFGGGALNGGEDLDVAGAAAQVAGEPDADFFLRG